MCVNALICLLRVTLCYVFFFFFFLFLYLVHTAHVFLFYRDNAKYIIIKRIKVLY